MLFSIFRRFDASAQHDPSTSRSDEPTEGTVDESISSNKSALGTVGEDTKEQASVITGSGHMITTSMNEDSFGTPSATGLHDSRSKRTPSDDFPQYLCIPVDSRGTAYPSKAFTSRTRPDNSSFVEELAKTRPMSSTELIGVLKAGMNAGQETTQHDLRSVAPMNDKSPSKFAGLSCSVPNGLSRNTRADDGHLDLLASASARITGDNNMLPAGHESPSQTHRLRPNATMINPPPDAHAGLSHSVPNTLSPNTRHGRRRRKSSASMPDVRTGSSSPASSSLPPVTDDVNAKAQQLRYVFNGTQGQVKPLESILSNSSINSLADGARRVVLAKDGTPMACVGNTIEVLAPVETPVSDQRKWQRWTVLEDEILRGAVETEGSPPNWKMISKKYFLGVRSDTQCKNRWKKALQPGLLRGNWTAEEDKTIVDSMENGMKCSDIAKLLPGRISEQVKERWVNKLDPSLKKENWTEDELHILFAAQSRLGNQWKKIAELLPGRSENHVKNRWYNAKNAEKRQKARTEREKRLRESKVLPE